jgi:hypothetical protein
MDLVTTEMRQAAQTCAAAAAALAAARVGSVEVSVGYGIREPTARILHNG